MNSKKLIAAVQRNPVLWDTTNSSYNQRDKADEGWDEIATELGVSKEAAKKRWKNIRDCYRRELKKVKSGGIECRWPHFRPLTFLKDHMDVRKKRKDRVRLSAARQGTQEEDDDDDSTGDDRSKTGAAELAIDTDDEVTASVAVITNPVSLSENPDATNNNNDDDDQNNNDDDQNKNDDDKNNDDDDSSSSSVTPCMPEVSTPRTDRPNSIPNTSTSRPLMKRKPTDLGKEELVRREKKERPSIQDDANDPDMNFFRSVLPYMRMLSPVRVLTVRSKIQNILAEELSRKKNERCIVLSRIINK